jgi:hypothetical protein
MDGRLWPVGEGQGQRHRQAKRASGTCFSFSQGGPLDPPASSLSGEHATRTTVESVSTGNSHESGTVPSPVRQAWALLQQGEPGAVLTLCHGHLISEAFVRPCLPCLSTVH